MSRLRWDKPTQDYMAQRTAEGRTKREAIRCLKRYVAREIYLALKGMSSDRVTRWRMRLPEEATLRALDIHRRVNLDRTLAILAGATG